MRLDLDALLDIQELASLHKQFSESLRQDQRPDTSALQMFKGAAQHRARSRSDPEPKPQSGHTPNPAKTVNSAEKSGGAKPWKRRNVESPTADFPHCLENAAEFPTFPQLRRLLE